MGCDHHRLFSAPLLDHLPEVALGSGVHRRRWLVQEEQRRAPNQRDRQAQLALHASTVLNGLPLGIHAVQAQAVEQGFDGVGQGCLRNTLDASEEQQVLRRGQVLPQGVYLRAHPQHLEGLMHALHRGDIMAQDANLASSGRAYLACQHRQGGGLPGAVGPKQPEALPRPDAKTDAPHRRGFQLLPLHPGPVGVVQLVVHGCVLVVVVEDACVHPGLFRKNVIVLATCIKLLEVPGHGAPAPGILVNQIHRQHGNHHHRAVERDGSPRYQEL
mmetsp:Transcript_112818/g.268783  ORF Transcript_112818/g.268783 Transcript_112818/m.268783 type:complete len:272 (+) Transcript_112818:536-1351(+)